MKACEGFKQGAVKFCFCFLFFYHSALEIKVIDICWAGPTLLYPFSYPPGFTKYLIARCLSLLYPKLSITPEYSTLPTVLGFGLGLKLGLGIGLALGSRVRIGI